MKKIVALVAVAIALVSFMGCSTTTNTGYVDSVGWSDYTSGFEQATDVVIKDFDVIGIVSTEFEVQDKTGFLRLTSSSEGYQAIYAELLKQAEAKGAHDIVNVYVDTIVTGKKNFIFGGTTTTKYVATANAIKYKDATADTVLSPVYAPSVEVKKEGFFKRLISKFKKK
jgi:hypothetical protein